MPPKKSAFKCVMEVKTWCAEKGIKHGFPQESADHLGHDLAKKLWMNKQNFT